MNLSICSENFYQLATLKEVYNYGSLSFNLVILLHIRMPLYLILHKKGHRMAIHSCLSGFKVRMPATARHKDWRDIPLDRRTHPLKFRKGLGTFGKQIFNQ